ncbi:SDR family NAD(P)-dependent oxidoreductase [Rhodococcus koreensis]
MNDLAGLTAVVTGGNQGIGLSMAIGMAKAGANIAVWGRNPDRNRDAAAQIEGHGVKAVPVTCDVGDEAQVEDAMERTVGELGPLGCFVANAGLAGNVPLVETSLAQWHEVLRTNLDGAFLCSRAAARRFVAQDGGGSIVIVSSMVSRYGASNQAAYATSKTGLLGLGRTLAVELARYRVRTNILVPGWTRTAMNTDLRLNDRFMEATTTRTPLRRWASADEFEEIAAFLADPRLEFHTGNEVVVDGGYSIF